MSDSVYQHSHGYTIPIRTGASLVGVTALLLELRKPNGSVTERTLTAADIADVTAGVVKYVVQPDDFDQLDVYVLQLIDITGGARLYFAPASLVCYPGLA